MTQPIRIAYILSVGHSGSSLLDVLLGDSDGAFSIGEVKLNHQGLMRNINCTCGQSIRDCGFWQQVEEKLDNYNQSIFSTRLDGDLTTSEQEGILRFYRAIMDVSGARLVIDSSKSIGRLRALNALDNAIDLKVVYLERAPQGVVASNFRKGRSWIKHTFTYLLNNTSKRHIASINRSLHISYDSVAENPQKTIGDIYNYLNFEAELADPNKTNLPSKKHMLGGNAMLYRPIAGIKPDIRWKTELSWFQKLFIGVICHPFMQRIVYLLVSTVRSTKKMFSSRRW